MALDRSAKILWVALKGVSKLARVELASAKVTEVGLTYPARGLALRAGGDLFVSLDDGSSLKVPVARVKAGAVIASVIASGVFPLLAFDDLREHLIVAQAGLSPSSLARYQYDPATGVLTVSESVSACTNGRALALSPDAKRLALVCAGAPYVVSDRVPDKLAVTQGSFAVGAYPEDAAFSPDGSELVATDREKLHRFAVATHALTASHTLDYPLTGQVSRVGFSTGGKIIFGLRSNATVVWLSSIAVH
jgi:DNA-binding beta-propeller fold protein YncE